MKMNCLQTIMNERQLSYRQLAKLSGVSKSTLHRIANLEQTPTQDIMIAIAKSLKMKVIEIFNFKY